MRRIVLVLVLVVIVVIAGFMLLRPKRGSAQPKSVSAATDTSALGGATAARPAGGKAAKAGKVAGALTASTPEQRRAQAKVIRDAENARKKELKRQAREKKRMLAKAGRAHGGRAGKGQGLYVLKAVIAMGNDNYAMVDTRKVQVGDIVLGRRIVSIGQDRIEIEAFGRRSTVRVGESLVPSS